MNAVKTADLRKFPRRRFDVRVTIHDHIRGRRTLGRAVDVKPMGLLLAARAGFGRGETIALRFPAPAGGYDLTAAGEIVRIEQHRGKTTYALEFFGVDDSVFEVLCRYVYAKDAELVLMVGG